MVNKTDLEARSAAKDGDADYSASQGQASSGPSIVPPSYEDSMATSQHGALAQQSAHPGYGASPYQPSHTARIVILAPSQSAQLPAGAIRVSRPPGADPAQASAPPNNGLHGRRSRPRPLRRFLAALFWAWMLYLTLCLVLAAVIEAAERNSRRHEKPGKRPIHGSPELPPLPPPETRPPRGHSETTMSAMYKQLLGL